MHSFYLPPGKFDLLSVTGPDAGKLLQGQLTCDVASIPDPGFVRGALCNNKGRVIASFILVRQGAAYYVALNRGLGNVFALTLKKFLPFYKCEMRDIFSDACFGVCGDAVLSSLALAGAAPPHGECRALDDGWICNLDQTQQQFLILSRQPVGPAPGTATGTLNDWLACGIRSGQFPFDVDDVEKYTPQELHLDRHGYVSFTKGCYTGQEIVARLHYRGKLKKLLYMLETSATDGSDGTTDFLDSSGELLGTSIKTLRYDGGLIAFAHLSPEIETSLVRPVKNRAGLQFELRVF